MEKQEGPAVFPTIHSPPWGIFDALLAEATNRRALVFYEPSNLGVARLLQSGVRTLAACETWLSEARSLERFVQAHSRYVTLVRVDKARMAPRSLLSACADRFLFDLVDPTARPAMASLPPLVYRLAAEFAAQYEPALRTLDDRLDSLAFAPDTGPETEPGELDRFIADYLILKDSQQTLERVQAESDALRVANRLAEESAQALRVQLADLDVRLSSALKAQTDAGSTGGSQRNSVAVLEAEIEQLRRALGDVQLIAETHVSEAAELRERLRSDEQRLAMLEAQLSDARSQLSADNVSAEAAAGEAPLSQALNGQDIAFARRPSLMTRLNPRLWWQMRRDRDLVLQSELFDADWYMKKNADLQAMGVDPARHFVRHGGQEGRDPGAAFSSRRYLEDNPDVARAGFNPLVHYLRLGRAEGRKIHRADKA